MNKVMLMGRLTKDAEYKMTTSGKACATFTLAVDRRKENEADFIQVQCWDKLADFSKTWLQKGKLIIVEGRINTGSYDKQDGTKVYYTNVVADHIEFAPINEREKVVEAPVQPQVHIDNYDDLPF